MKVQVAVRDRLARVAAADYPGVPLSDVVDRLLAEHEELRLRREMTRSYARLQDDPQEWAGYLAELEEWDGVSADRGEAR